MNQDDYEKLTDEQKFILCNHLENEVWLQRQGDEILRYLPNAILENEEVIFMDYGQMGMRLIQKSEEEGNIEA